MKAINVNELTKILWNLFGNPNKSSWIGDESLPEKSILRYKYEDKIKHIEADFIENESGGINRLEKVDSTYVKVEIEVWDYISSNFEQDFKDEVNDETILEYIELGQVDKEEVEHSINAVIGNLCKLFCKFSVLGGEKLYPELGDNPWEHPETIYLEVSVPVISLTDLNPDWTDDKFSLVKNEISEVINEDFSEEINKVEMVCEEIFTEKISYGEWKNFFNSKGYEVKMTIGSFEIFMKDIIIRIAHKDNKHHYPEKINFIGEIFVGWVQKGECFNGEKVRCYCSYCKKNPNSRLNKY